MNDLDRVRKQAKSIQETVRREIAYQTVEANLGTSVLCVCNVVLNLIDELQERNNEPDGPRSAGEDSGTPGGT